MVVKRKEHMKAFSIFTETGEFCGTWYGKDAATVAEEHGCRIVNSCPGWVYMVQKTDNGEVGLQMKWLD